MYPSLASRRRLWAERGEGLSGGCKAGLTLEERLLLAASHGDGGCGLVGSWLCSSGASHRNCVLAWVRMHNL